MRDTLIYKNRSNSKLRPRKVCLTLQIRTYLEFTSVLLGILCQNVSSTMVLSIGLTETFITKKKSTYILTHKIVRRFKRNVTIKMKSQWEILLEDLFWFFFCFANGKYSNICKWNKFMIKQAVRRFQRVKCTKLLSVVNNIRASKKQIQLQSLSH